MVQLFGTLLVKLPVVDPDAIPWMSGISPDHFGRKTGAVCQAAIAAAATSTVVTTTAADATTTSTTFIAEFKRFHSKFQRSKNSPTFTCAKETGRIQLIVEQGSQTRGPYVSDPLSSKKFIDILTHFWFLLSNFTYNLNQH